MPPAAPSKRRLSEISVPPLPSSSHASSYHHHGHDHPFGNPMHLFHRGRGKQPRPPPEERAGATKPAHEQRVHFRPPARQQPNSEMAYVPPAMHGRAGPAAASKLAALDATRAVVPSNPSSKQATSKPTKPSDTSSAASSASAPVAEWRQARCPRTGKPYYWNARTRESRWKKPLALASAEERAAIETKERKQREFFEGMERNILRRLEEGQREKMEREAEEARGGIDRSWTQADTSSPTEGTNDGIDQSWISGWITPGSGGDPARSPTGSLSSTEGLSVVTPGSTGTFGSGLSREERDDKLYPLQKPSRIQRIKSSSNVIDKPDLIRTISKMEYDLVHQLNPALVPAKASTKPLRIHADHRSVSPGANGTCGMDLVPLTPTAQTCDILSSLRLTLGADGLDVSLDSLLPGGTAPITPTSPMTPASLEPATPGSDASPTERSTSSPNTATTAPGPREGVAKPGLAKRNTCGTIYLGSTLAAPDKDALIQCVCGVYRAHLLQAANAGGFQGVHSPPTTEDPHDIFRDRRAPGDYRPLDVASVPALAQITDFYRSVFLRSQMEVDCIVISLIYVERLIKLTGGALAPRPNNWRSVLYSCMVLASKVWDDLSMWNGDFSKIGPAGVTFSLARTNELEVALLRALEYRVKVGAGEYAKYYFLLRGMLCRSGLANDDLAKMQPLDVEGARTLEGLDVARTTLDASPGAAATGDKGAVAVGELKERSKSYGDMGASAHSEAGKFSQDDGSGGAIRAASATGAAPPQPSPRSSPASKRVSLEQIVRM
ncbi:hypothetical protein ACHAXT_010738 [Thalassiosira profunda]